MGNKRMTGTAKAGAPTGMIDTQTGSSVGVDGQPLPHTCRFIPWGSDARFERCSCGAVHRADAQGAATGEPNPNPCVQRWGRGPEVAQCKTCIHLVREKQATVWYKCGLRDDLTHGAKTDHRVRWDACARYEAREPEPAEMREVKPSVPMEDAALQALAAMPAPAPKRGAPRFTVGQSVKVIANQGGLYAAQIGVTGVIERKRDFKQGAYWYHIGYATPKGAAKIVIVREDDLEAAATQTLDPDKAAEVVAAALATEPRFTLGQKVMLDHRSDAAYHTVARKGAVGVIVGVGRTVRGIRRYDVRYPRYDLPDSSDTIRIREEHLLPVIAEVDGAGVGLRSVTPVHRPVVIEHDDGTVTMIDLQTTTVKPTVKPTVKRDKPRFTVGQQVWLTPDAHQRLNPRGARNGVVTNVHRKRLGRRLYDIEITDSYAKTRRRTAYEDEMTDESEAAS